MARNPEDDVEVEGPEAGPRLVVEPPRRRRRAVEQPRNEEAERALASRWLEPFATTLQTARVWMREVGVALGTNDPRDAWHALQAVLATVRDQLPVQEVADLAAELPPLLRGVYLDGWAGRQDRASDAAGFYAAVERRLGDEAETEPGRAVRAVFEVLKRHVSPGELRDIRGQLPGEIQAYAG